MGLGSFITKWSVRGIARTQLRLFRLTQEKSPGVSEQDIAQLLFQRRMTKIRSSFEQQHRCDMYFDENGPIRNLREACHAIAVIEFKIHPCDVENVVFLTDIIDEELGKLGYVIDSIPNDNIDS